MEEVNKYFSNSKVWEGAQWDKGYNSFNIVCGLKSQSKATDCMQWSPSCKWWRNRLAFE